MATWSCLANISPIRFRRLRHLRKLRFLVSPVVLLDGLLHSERDWIDMLWLPVGWRRRIAERHQAGQPNRMVTLLHLERLRVVRKGVGLHGLAQAERIQIIRHTLGLTRFIVVPGRSQTS